MARKQLIRASVVLGLVLLCTLSAFLLRHIVPFEIQSLLSPSHPVRLQYEKDLKSFNDEASVWIVVEADHVMPPQEIFGLSKKVAGALESNAAFDAVSGPHNAKYFEVDGHSLQLTPFFRNGEWTSRAQEMLKTELWKKNLIREDFTGFLVSFRFVQNLPRNLEKPALDRVQAFLHQLEHDNPGLQIGLLGAKVASAHFLKEMQFQQKVITPLLLLAIGLFLFFCYRSWQILIWNFLVMFVCYASTLCLIIFVEGGLGPYSSFALMFTFIVATTDLIQFFSRFQQLEGTVEARLKQTLKIAYVPCLLTSLTTAAGFFALILNQNLPIRYFGLYCAFACVLEWFVIFYLLPIALRAFDFNPRVYRVDAAAISNRLQSFVARNSKGITMASVLLVILGMGASLNLKIDDNFYTKFKDDHPLSRTLDIFSRGFDFVGSMDVVISPALKKNQDDLFNSDFLQAAQNLEKDLKAHPMVSRLTSLRQVKSEMDRQMSPSVTEDNKKAILHLFNDYGVIRGGFYEATNEMRLGVFLRSLSSADLNSVLSFVEDLKIKYQDRLTIRSSGFSSVRSYINGRVIRDFFESFALSFVLIFLCYLYLFRSFKWAALGLIPNAIPLLAVSGAMGIFQVPVDTNLVILICVAFGIVGDNTVHLTYVLQQEQKAGLSYDRALQKALKLIGVAIFASTGIFIFCLPVFLLGDLRLFGHLAIFLSLAFIAAFFADTVSFPALQKEWGWSVTPESQPARLSHLDWVEAQSEATPQAPKEQNTAPHLDL